MTRPFPPRPAPGTPREYRFPSFETRTLGNGLRVIVAPVHTNPVVTILAITEAGAAAEPDDKAGIAALAARALTEGTPSHDGEELTTRLESLGTSAGGAADWDSASLSMTLLSERLDAAFPLFAETLTAPTFPEAAIERMKGERIAEIMQTETEPRELADERFDEYIYRATSRFRLPLGGTRDTVNSIGRDDVAAFYAARYRPASTTIIVVGDISTDAAVAMIDKRLGTWSGSAAPIIRVDDSPVRMTRALSIVEKNDAPQSELRIGHIGIPRSHPDYFDVTVMNAVLGGLFSSRINLNLREAHGYTYGASSAYDWRREAGPFVIGTAVASNVTAAAITETLKEIDRMRSEPVDENELSLATSYLDGVFPIRYETTGAIAAALASLVIYELPNDYYDTYRSKIRSVTPESVLAAAQTHVHPEWLQIVIVGDASVRDDVAALGFDS